MDSSGEGLSGAARRSIPAISLGLLLLLAFRGLLSGRLFYLRDVTQNHYPLRALVTERLGDLSLPLWDPLHGGGTPLLANPNALVLHPISLLFFVLPFDAAFVASIVLQFALLAAGGYLLARALGLGREASLLAASVLSLSGPVASLASMQNVLSAAAWVPLALWALLRGAAPGRRWLLAPAALCTAVVLMTAEPASLLALVLLGGVLAATEPAPVAATRRLRPGACLVGLTVLAAATLAAAAQIVPAGGLLPLSERGAGFGAAEGLKWSLLPARLPELLLPQLFGDPTRLSPVSWWGGFLFEGHYPFLLSIYVGALPCLLVVLGAWHRGAQAGRRRALGVVGAVGLLLALGRHSAGYRFLFDVFGPARQVRYPERFVLVFLFAAALLAGYGLDRLLASPSRRARQGLAAAAVATFLLCACSATGRFADVLLRRFSDVPSAFLATDAGAMLRTALLRSTLWAFGESAVVLLLAVYLAGRPTEARARGAVLATVLLSSVSLTLASSPVRSMAAAGWLTAPSPLRPWVGHGPGEPRLHHAPRPAELSVRGSTDELVWGYRYDRFTYALMTGHADGVPTSLDAATDRMDLRESADLGRSVESLPLPRRVRVLAASRVGYLLSYEALDDPGLDAGPVLEGLSLPPARLYRVRAVVPRLRFVGRARALSPGEDLAAALSDPGYDPESAVLLEADAAPVASAGDGRAAAAGAGRAVILREAPERIAMRVQANEAGYAVLADAYAPGWRARLDDRPVPILRADGLFRAVAVPAGEHTVDLDYRPRSVRAGLALGGLGLLLVGAFGVAARWRSW